MRLILASRKSDLARIQAYAVGEALKQAHPGLEITYQFRESLGDKNLNDPLWQMPEKGVFTQDFHDDLVSGRADLVVHSWKDLPTESPEGTEIAATMPRADMRDLFLFRKDRWETVRSSQVLRIFSSSPRRAYNLEVFFKEAFPTPLETIKFETIRGNVPTRLFKLLGPDGIGVDGRGADGLIVAKAALDRILSAGASEFTDAKNQVMTALEKCFFMVLPLHQNPGAAAQGALAIEIVSGRKEIKNLLRAIHDPVTYQTVMVERGILSGLGGGCHQKIGVSCLRRGYGDFTFVRALTDHGKKIDSVEFRGTGDRPGKTSSAHVFPLEPGEQNWFERVPLKNIEIPEGPLWVAKALALPDGFSEEPGRLVWTGGWETWKKLAKRGCWVNGSSESLGEDEDPRLDILLLGPPKWTKLSHGDSGESPKMRTVATYELKSKETVPDLEGKTHFYWMSGTSFERALKAYPWIREARNSCGPGNTYVRMRRILGNAVSISVFPSHALWLKEVLK